MKFSERDHFFRVLEFYGLRSDRIETCTEANGAPDRISFDVPEGHAQVAWFANFLMSLAAPEHEFMILPSQRGVWPSSEHRHLYDTVRRAHHGNTSLTERPCHCFSAEEIDNALDFICLFLLFSWDFYVFCYRAEDILFVSHDGFGAYFSPSRIDSLTKLIEAGSCYPPIDGTSH